MVWWKLVERSDTPALPDPLAVAGEEPAVPVPRAFMRGSPDSCLLLSVSESCRLLPCFAFFEKTTVSAVHYFL